MNFPAAPYASVAELRCAIGENTAYCAEVLGDYAYELVDIVLKTHGAEVLCDEVRAWEDKRLKAHAQHLWDTEPWNYRASRSELREMRRMDEGMDARRAA